VARGRLQALPLIEPSAAAASSALGSTRNFGRDSGRMTGLTGRKAQVGRRGLDSLRNQASITLATRSVSEIVW
jgi:hypothetical protein